MDRVILIGFMGSGKTSVGRLLAARLGWELVDTDALVEAQAGARVADIFRDRGEPAFRELEARALASLAGRTGVVVATGGGAPAQPRNRAFFAGGTGAAGRTGAAGEPGGQAVFHLRVSMENALRRTAGSRERPLLSRPDAEVRALFEERRRIYESMGTGVETDERSPGEIADEILGLLRNPRPGSRPAGSG